MSINFAKYKYDYLYIPNSVSMDPSWYRKFDKCKTMQHLGLEGGIVNRITNINATYRNCINLVDSPVCGENVTDMSFSYFNCRSLTGEPVCGNNVTTMQSAYYQCKNLTGQPVCGENVINMQSTYAGCNSLTGSPVCGANVVNMHMCYWSCHNITGQPVCGNKVQSLYMAYSMCSNLIGEPVCGPNVVNMYSAYAKCYNLSGNCYILSDNITNAMMCFEERYNTSDLHVYVNKNTSSLECMVRNDYKSIMGTIMNWTMSGDTYYSGWYNIYVHPVDNVRRYMN